MRNRSSVNGREACCWFLIYQAQRLSWGRGKEKRRQLGLRGVSVSRDSCLHSNHLTLRLGLWAQFGEVASQILQKRKAVTFPRLFKPLCSRRKLEMFSFPPLWLNTYGEANSLNPVPSWHHYYIQIIKAMSLKNLLMYLAFLIGIGLVGFLTFILK